MSTAFVGLGANIGDPIKQIETAISALDSLPGVAVMRASPLYRSMPMGPDDQPDFINACVKVGTTLTPHALLKAMQKIETNLGRKRLRRWGERCIDIDLLLFDDQQIFTSTLALPHPGLRDRDFVLKPLMDIVGREASLPLVGNLDTLLRQAPDHQLQRLDYRLGDSDRSESHSA